MRYAVAPSRAQDAQRRDTAARSSRRSGGRGVRAYKGRSKPPVQPRPRASPRRRSGRTRRALLRERRACSACRPVAAARCPLTAQRTKKVWASHPKRAPCPSPPTNAIRPAEAAGLGTATRATCRPRCSPREARPRKRANPPARAAAYHTAQGLRKSGRMAGVPAPRPLRSCEALAIARGAALLGGFWWPLHYAQRLLCAFAPYLGRQGRARARASCRSSPQASPRTARGKETLSRYARSKPYVSKVKS